MSPPAPHDRARARQDQGEQPYKDAREAMAEMDASIQAEAEAFGEARDEATAEERLARLEADAEASMRAVGADRQAPTGEGEADRA